MRKQRILRNNKMEGLQNKKRRIFKFIQIYVQIWAYSQVEGSRSHFLSQGFCFSSLLFLVRVHVARFAEALGVVGHIGVLTIYGRLSVSSDLMVTGPAISFGVVVFLCVDALVLDGPPLSFSLF